MDLGHTGAIVDNPLQASAAAMLWDIFCKVIDNHGDIGVCWRLSAQLAARGEQVRLWVDDGTALQWMAPQGAPGVEVLPWQMQASVASAGDVVIEAFGCELDAAFQAALAEQARTRGRQPAWVNLEYLTAESFAQRSHGLPSPVLAGPAAGLTKHFFYPGLVARTGGLLREPDLLLRQARFDRAAWLRRQGVEPAAGARVVSLFCYEPPALEAWLAQLAAGPEPTRLLVTAGRATAGVRRALASSQSNASALAITFLPLLTQLDFDHLLWSCDLNFVRGEDSLVRALWAGRPFVWQLYPQDDDAHHAKLRAFLDWLQAPASWRAFHRFWNGEATSLPDMPVAEWAEAALQARERLLREPDLVTQLLRFVAERRG
jgi:uncharacterized repeat protein (TIGR03837 family)